MDRHRRDDHDAVQQKAPPAVASRFLLTANAKPERADATDIAKAFVRPPPPPGEAPPPAPDLWPLFKGLAAGPLLTIRGGTSDLLSADIARRMREAAPGMAYAEVSGVGHAPMLDEPQALAAIDALLETAP